MENYLQTTEISAECASIWQLCHKASSLREQVKILLEHFLHRPYANLATPIVSNLTAPEAAITFANFDCVTLVETVFAMIHALDYARADKFQALFITNLLSIRYYRGIDTFLFRNHLMETDWLPNNSWILQGITYNLGAEIAIASANINKLAWLTLHKALNANAKAMVAEVMQANALDFGIKQATMPYIPSTYFVNNRQSLSANFPDVAVVNIVRPGWDLTASIGTELNISHLGITVKDQAGVLQFYHASSVPKMVVCESLHAYLEKYLDSPTIKGINVLGYALHA